LPLSDGRWFQSILSPGFQMIGTDMPGPPLTPSSPLSIEPITMRVPDACRYTGISRSTLYLLIARGEVEVVKMGAATLVLTESLRQLIERYRCASPSPMPQLTQVASARHGHF
jgi:excisionase family DNA binding protein